jgi:hypothetical protein
MTAVAVLAVTAMLLGGCQGTTEVDAPASAADNAATGNAATGNAEDDNAATDTGADDNEGGDAWATKQPVVDNGVSGLPADEIIRRARTALRQAKSFHATGTLYGKHAPVNNGQPNGVYLEVVGKNYYEQVEFDNGTKVEFLSAGGVLHVRSSKKFFKSIGYEMPANKWISMDSPADCFGGVFRNLDIDGMFKFSGKLSKEDTATGEEEVVLVSDASGAELYVPMSGDLLPIEARAADESKLDFRGFGEAYPDVKKPPAAQVVDYNYLVGE